MNMQIRFIPYKQCDKCHRKQWWVEDGWQPSITRKKNESDAKFKKREKENKELLKTAQCQFCQGGGMRHNLDPNSMGNFW